MRRNRVYRLRSGVAGHHDGRYVPAKGGAQVPDGLDTIRRTLKVVVTQQNIRSQAPVSDQSQGFRRRRNNGGLNPPRLQQSLERRAHRRLVLDGENAAQEGITMKMCGRRYFPRRAIGSTARDLDEKPCTLSGDRAHLDPMIQDVSEPFHDRKTQAEPAPLRAAGPLVVFIEYVRELIFGDTDATVPDFNANVVAGAPASEQNSVLCQCIGPRSTTGCGSSPRAFVCRCGR